MPLKYKALDGALALFAMLGVAGGWWLLNGRAQNVQIFKSEPDIGDEFVPKSIRQAVAGGCTFVGVNDPEPYTETQVFLKFDKTSKGWDFKPILSRRALGEGGVNRAIEDCREWLKEVQKALQKAAATPETQQTGQN